MTQNKTILNHLQSFGSITSYEAFVKYRITRLASRIHNLREMDYDFEVEMVTKNKKTYARYTLKGQEEIFTDKYKQTLLSL